MQNTKSKSGLSHTGKPVHSTEMPLIQQGDNLLIDARLLHKQLNVKHKFADWIRNRIKEYRFSENLDYLKTSEKRVTKNTYEYHLTLDMAKELCMLERSEAGRAFRRYFIEAEKELRTKRLYATQATFTEINKTIKPIVLNGRKMYDLRRVQTALGYSTKTSTGNVRRCNPGLIVVFNGRAYVAEEYVKVMMAGAKIKALRQEARAAQPVLPLEFSTEKLQEGGANG